MNKQSVPATHKTKAVPGGVIGGSWVPVCTCGWTGEKQHSTGARDRARSLAYDHEIDMEDATQAGDSK